MKVEDIESEVLERLRPDDEERNNVARVSRELLVRVEEEIEGDYEPEIVGSVSKGTYLKDPDIDVFLKFPLITSREVMEKKILDAGRNILKDVKEKYAEHPYIYGKYEGYEVDIVPCYDLEDMSQMKSAVDRTPFHTEYVKEHLEEKQKKEAMLLKAFLEGIGAYGAKAKVWGFSGYLCELLILHYGTFKKTLEEASGWKIGHTIEMVEGEKDSKDPFVVIDPVDPGRNVAAPVSKENFSLFVLSSKLFLDDPSLDFFFPNEIKTLEKDELIDKIDERGTELLGLRFPRPDVVEDNLYPQIQKCERRLVHHLSHRDFEILHSDYFVEEDTLLLILELVSGKLPEMEKHRGPPVWVGNTEEFIEKYGSEVYLEGDRVWVDRDREYSDVKKAVTDIMEKIDLGSDISGFLPENTEFLSNDDMVSDEKRALTEFFDRRFPWER